MGTVAPLAYDGKGHQAYLSSGTASCFFLWIALSIWHDPGTSWGIREEAILYNRFQLAVLMEKTCCELPESKDGLQTKSQFIVFVPILI